MSTQLCPSKRLPVSSDLPRYRRSWKSGVLGKILTTRSRIKKTKPSVTHPAGQIYPHLCASSVPGVSAFQVRVPLSLWLTPGSLLPTPPLPRCSRLPSAADWSFPALAADQTHSQLTSSLFQILFFVTGSFVQPLSQGGWSSPALLLVRPGISCPDGDKGCLINLLLGALPALTNSSSPRPSLTAPWRPGAVAPMIDLVHACPWDPGRGWAVLGCISSSVTSLPGISTPKCPWSTADSRSLPCPQPKHWFPSFSALWCHLGGLKNILGVPVVAQLKHI